MPIFQKRGHENGPPHDAKLTNRIIIQADEERGAGYFSRVGVWPFEIFHIDLVARVYLLDQDPRRVEKFLMNESMYHKVLHPDEMGLPRFEILLV